MKPHKATAKAVEKATDQLTSELARIAESYRKSVVIPYCRKYRLTFLAGNGSWCFYDPKGEPISSENLPGDPTEMVDTLFLDDWSRFDCLGFHVSDVTKKDY